MTYMVKFAKWRDENHSMSFHGRWLSSQRWEFFCWQVLMVAQRSQDGTSMVRQSLDPKGRWVKTAKHFGQCLRISSHRRYRVGGCSKIFIHFLGPDDVSIGMKCPSMSILWVDPWDSPFHIDPGITLKLWKIMEMYWKIPCVIHLCVSFGNDKAKQLFPCLKLKPAQFISVPRMELPGLLLVVLSALDFLSTNSSVFSTQTSTHQVYCWKWFNLYANLGLLLGGLGQFWCVFFFGFDWYSFGWKY